MCPLPTPISNEICTVDLVTRVKGESKNNVPTQKAQLLRNVLIFAPNICSLV